MKLWLKNLKLATCYAENLFDEITYESLKGGKKKKTKKQVGGPKEDKVSNFCSLKFQRTCFFYRKHKQKRTKRDRI